MASQALLGTPIKILKKKKGWYLVQTPDQYISWIENDGITASILTAYLPGINRIKLFIQKILLSHIQSPI